MYVLSGGLSVFGCLINVFTFWPASVLALLFGFICIVGPVLLFFVSLEMSAYVLGLVWTGFSFDTQTSFIGHFSCGCLYWIAGFLFFISLNTNLLTPDTLKASFPTHKRSN